MRIVVLSGGNRLPSESVLSFVAEVRDEATVDLVSWGPPTDRVRSACDRVVVLGPHEHPPAAPPPTPVASAPTEAAPTAPARTPPTGLSRDRIAAAVAWRRRRLRRFVRSWLGRAWTLLGRDRAKTWRRVRRSPQAMELVDRADLVVALDGQAIRAAWTVARRRPGLAAVWGLPAAGVAARRLAVARSALDAEQVADDS